MKPDEYIKTMDDLIEHFRGTCRGFYELDEYDLTDDEYGDFDEAIFSCDQCGWWWETYEMADDDEGRICTECHQDNEEL